MDNVAGMAVVVGVDGSPESRAAVDLAGWEGYRRRLPVRLIRVGPAGERIRGRLDRESAQLRERYPDLPTSVVVTDGDPAGVLVDESRGAALVAVGARGLGSFHCTLPGSVAVAVARHTRAPAIVVPRLVPRYRAGVVVVIDAPAGTGAAVEFAFDEAAGRGCELTAVCVADCPPAPAPDADPVLSAALGGWPDKYPQVELLRRVPVDRNRLRAYLEESAHAELVVVGGGAGPIATGLIAHAGTAVAVVPG
jgi:nucleotide-binding universal stress UspA family protein